VNRVGEGINVTFDSILAFQINSSELNASYKEDLKALQPSLIVTTTPIY
jgi:hypothetical protein